MTNNQITKKKIALFYGGKLTRHLVLIRAAARKEKVDLELISYNQVFFDSSEGRVKLRGKKEYLDKIQTANDFDVLFFRTTGKHWEEVDLIINSIESNPTGPIVVDPLVRNGKPSYACKAWQMLELQRNGIEVPQSIYGSLWFLYEVMKNGETLRQNFLDSDKSSQNIFCGAHALRPSGSDVALRKNVIAANLEFPIILKGSGGDRGTRVFKADNLKELEVLVRQLRKTETEEGKRYMLQEFIQNEGDYRVLVLGEKVLGVMKRSRQKAGEFRNNFSMGGKVEIADLPEEIKQLAVKAAKVSGLMIAGVDVIYDERSGKAYILEVNKGPQFWGFMEATKIDVPREIVNYLKNL